MQVILHPSGQEQGTGSSDLFTEPGFSARSIIIKVSAISINLLGNVTLKLQHSADGTDWIDVPNAATGGLTGTGTTTVTISPAFECMNHLRLVWTFSNANSITFFGAALGTK